MLQLAYVVTALACLSAADGTPDPRPPPGLVDGATAQRLQAGGATVLDVRTAEEFERGHVPGAINIPHDEVPARSAEVGPKEKPVVLYCGTGRRSALAAAALVKQGFTAVYDFKSISDWPGPVEQGPATGK